jgi:hypothetical protein
VQQREFQVGSFSSSVLTVRLKSEVGLFPPGR